MTQEPAIRQNMPGSVMCLRLEIPMKTSNFIVKSGKVELIPTASWQGARGACRQGTFYYPGMLSFPPKTVPKELLSELPARSRRVLSDRFGLSGKGESRTLDAIGQEYGITRERIRQIENHGLMS